jgi:phosphate-selective porin OprO/OprP
LVISKTIAYFLIFAWLILLSVELKAQNESDEKPLINVSNGISFKRDSLFLLNLRFRMQNRVAFNTKSGSDLELSSIEARIRRLRLRLDGFLLTPKLGYYIQLSFSKADQDLEEQEIPQIIRDGIVYYTFNKNFYVGFGQTKLPGNNERVVSSGNLQFADRSITNANLAINL